MSTEATCSIAEEHRRGARVGVRHDDVEFSIVAHIPDCNRRCTHSSRKLGIHPQRPCAVAEQYGCGAEIAVGGHTVELAVIVHVSNCDGVRSVSGLEAPDVTESTCTVAKP